MNLARCGSHKAVVGVFETGRRSVLRRLMLTSLLLAVVGAGCAAAGQRTETQAWSPRTATGLDVQLDVPASWEWSEAQGVWVANPKPPEDKVFVIALGGETSEAAWAQTSSLLGLTSTSSGSSGVGLAQPPFQEGVGKLSSSGGDFAYAARALKRGDGAVVVAAFIQRGGAGGEGLYALTLELVSRVLNSAKIAGQGSTPSQ